LPQKAEGKKKYNWTKKKIIAASIIGAAVLSFVIFMVIALVLQLGPIRPIKSTEEEARVVGTVGGYEVRYEELRYVTLLHKQSLDAELGKYEELDIEEREAYEKELEARVLEDIKSNYVILSLCDKYGIDTDSRAVKKAVQNDIEGALKEDFGGDKDAYKTWLAENNMTDAFLRFTYKTYNLENALLDHFVENKIDIEYDETTKKQLVEYILESEDWVRTIHIFYPLTQPQGISTSYYDAGRAQSYALKDIESLRAIKGGESRYDAMLPMIGKVPMVYGFSTTGNGFYFTYGQMGESYESVAFALDIYDVSDVVETEDGCFVIMRLPKEEELVKAQADDLLNQYRYAALKNQMDAKTAELTFVGNDYFDSINLVEID
jgi:hypothetical protein